MLSLFCPVVIMVNLTALPWTELDNRNLVVAKSRCSELYPNSPCLKKFIKKDRGVYNAICTNLQK